MNGKWKKLSILGLLAILSVTVLCGCGSKKPETKPEPAKKPAKLTEQEILCAKYLDVLDHIKDYDFLDEGVDDGGPADYSFALVQMEKDGKPVLLVQRTPVSFPLSNVRIFQYDSKTEKMIAPENDCVAVGLTVSGYSGSLTVEDDGNSLSHFALDTSNGEVVLSRVTIADGKVQVAQEWTGEFYQMAERTGKKITWYDLSEKDSLQEILDGKKTESKVLEEVPSGFGDVTVFKRNGRMTLTGTVRTMTYREILDLQGMTDDDPVEDENKKYTLLVFGDSPQLVQYQPGNGSGLQENSAMMLGLIDGSKVAKYEGKTVTISYNPEKTWWPNDLRAPLGQPRTEDYTVK